MIKTIIIDDEPHAREKLELLLRKYCSDVEVVATAKNAEEGIAAINKYHPQLVFLDVEMPGVNGFQLLDQLPYRPYVILTTAKTEYAFTAFQYSVTDYLKKPITLPRFKEAIKKIEPYVEKQKDNNAHDIFIRADGKLIRLHNNEICFVEPSAIM